jgi:hypothetical protein
MTAAALLAVIIGLVLALAGLVLRMRIEDRRPRITRWHREPARPEGAP